MFQTVLVRQTIGDLHSEIFERCNGSPQTRARPIAVGVSRIDRTGISYIISVLTDFRTWQPRSWSAIGRNIWESASMYDTLAVDRLIDLWLTEDIGYCDLTVQVMIEPDEVGSFLMNAREPMIVSGSEVAADMTEAVRIIAGRAKVEASGGIRFDTIRPIAETGVDYISTSKITQAAPAVDIGLDEA